MTTGQPEWATWRRSWPAGATAVLAGLTASASALAVAPTLMPAGYSWLSRTTSESAAQGLSGAWLSRLGFLLFGLSVLLLADACRRQWGPWGTALHAAFGALMTAAAAFSHRPWQAGQVFDRTEDLLHSVAATAMGLAFAVGVVAVALGRVGPPRRRRAVDAVAVTAAVTIPLAMSALPSVDGFLQRLMFAVAFIWYGGEAVRGRLRLPATGAPRPSPRARPRSASVGPGSGRRG